MMMPNPQAQPKMQQPGMVSAPPTAAPEQPMPGGSPQVAGYPSGSEILSQQAGATQGGGEQVENPLMSGVRAIMAFAGELAKRNDPRAQSVVTNLKALLQSMAGAPQEPPVPMQQNAQPPAPGAGPMPGPGAGPMPGPGAGPMPGAGPSPMPPAAPAGGPNLVSEFDSQPPGAAPAPAPKTRPMGPVQMPQGKPMGKQPVVLT